MNDSAKLSTLVLINMNHWIQAISNSCFIGDSHNQEALAFELQLV